VQLLAVRPTISTAKDQPRRCPCSQLAGKSPVSAVASIGGSPAQTHRSAAQREPREEISSTTQMS
jgi:hypothetical protein